MYLFEEIEKNYIDKNGRCCFYPAHYVEKYNWEYNDLNQYLWTGELMLLKAHFGIIKLVDYDRYRFIGSITHCGDCFWTRQPPEKFLKSKKFDPISFDEHNGIAFSSVALRSYGQLHRIIEYGKKYGWCYYEKKLYINPFKEIIRKPIPFIKTLFKAIKFAIKTKDLTGSNDMDKIIAENEELVLLSRVRLPKDIAFLKICSPYHKPSFIGLLHFFISAIHTIKKPELSGKNMLFFKLMAFEQLGYEPLWVIWLRKYFNDKVDIVEVFDRFYYDNHPFKKIIRKI